MDFNEFQKKAIRTDQFMDKERSLASSFWNIHETVGSLSRLYDERDRIKQVNPERFKELCSKRLGDMLWYIANISDRLELDLLEIANQNIEKCEKRWGKKKHNLTPFDEAYPEDEQFPRNITFKLHETKEKLTRLAVKLENGRWHQLGARVTDNSHIDDGYRYHDVLHIAYMAILGWSPVMRSLLMVKRKSKEKIDEVEDGARAANLEEALTALIYEHARTVNYFRDETYVPFELLKWTEQLTRGLEANQITYDMWNKAILEGYKIWRQAVDNKGGFIEVDLGKQLIKYTPLLTKNVEAKK